MKYLFFIAAVIVFPLALLRCAFLFDVALIEHSLEKLGERND